MVSESIRKGVLEEMLLLEGRANVGPESSGHCGMGEAVGTAGHILISDHCL